jgi:transcriptional regulator with XRE-family HTH domain
MNVARMIAVTRVRLGLSQQEIARRAGTKQSRISELETLSGNVRFDTLDRIAMALGLEVALVERAAPFTSLTVMSSNMAPAPKTYRASAPIDMPVGNQVHQTTGVLSA